jgi:hypothetical protein
VKYAVVQRTGFVPYFLSEWTNGMDSWDCLRARALAFDGPTARRIVNQLNAKRPAAVVPVMAEELRR